ncbi:MAG: hypothetical protein A2496_12900 [Burkholderiales bacterium RIFOXYC12_FULL_60_6]|nr:MAG: hypothetical protein A2496_12900 [Burkholderiales bacterium RIFOXYC12_FULL_60_6]
MGKYYLSEIIYCQSFCYCYDTLMNYIRRVFSCNMNTKYFTCSFIYYRLYNSILFRFSYSLTICSIIKYISFIIYTSFFDAIFCHTNACKFRLSINNKRDS